MEAAGDNYLGEEQDPPLLRTGEAAKLDRVRPALDKGTGIQTSTLPSCRAPRGRGRVAFRLARAVSPLRAPPLQCLGDPNPYPGNVGASGAASLLPSAARSSGVMHRAVYRQGRSSLRPLCRYW